MVRESELTGDDEEGSHMSVMDELGLRAICGLFAAIA